MKNYYLLWLLVFASTAGAETDNVTDSLRAIKNARTFTEEVIVPFIDRQTALVEICKQANLERASWGPYSDGWKEWTPEQASKEKPSYDKAEYLWTVSKDADFRKKHLNHPLQNEFVRFQKSNKSKISEIFIADAKGGNIFQTRLTTDWYQGDEDKFYKAQTTVWYDKPQYDSSTKSTGVHVSVPVIDEAKRICVVILLVTADSQ